jgi:hypothetical protein
MNPLAEILNSVGYHPSYCQIKWLLLEVHHSPSSDIFKIIPAVKDADDQMMSVPHATNFSSMIVKLSTHARGIAEVRALNKLSPGSTRPDVPVFCPSIEYVIATIRLEDILSTALTYHPVNDLFLTKNHLNSVVADGVNTAIMDKHVDSLLKHDVVHRFEKSKYCKVGIVKESETLASVNTSSHWWNYRRKGNPVSYTAVLMYTAKERVKGYRGQLGRFSKSLGAVHSFGVLHCDLRPPNFLYFNIPTEMFQESATLKIQQKNQTKH